MTSLSFDADVAVVGAGVVGLAAAAELAEAGMAVLILERHPGPGRETSSRNSEVIHAGLYYPTGSLKARLCVEGARRLYELCERCGVGHRRLGKLVVASAPEEVPDLERLLALGTANGVLGLRLVDGAELHALEPAVCGVAALLSPNTGIVDSHGLLKVLEGRARAAGGLVLYQCELLGIERVGGERGFALRVRNPSGEEQLTTRLLVNAAGLEADRVAAAAGVPGYHLHWSKGCYCSVTGPAARSVSRLIYPTPKQDHLGVHVTLDLGGRMRLGPDAEYVARDAADLLSVGEEKIHPFWQAAHRYLPALSLDDLHPDLAGIRPKLQGPADLWRDFVIQDESPAGVPGLVNLVGIESPGLTSCLAIGTEVHRILG